MDPIGTISEGEWSCLSGMYTSVEADFMAQLLRNCPMTGPPDSSSNNGASSGFYWPNNHPESGIELGPNGGPFYDSHELVGGELVHFLQPSGDQDSYYIADKPCPIMVTTDHGPMSMEFCVLDASKNVSYLVEGNESSIQENVEETSGHHHQPDHQDRAKLDLQVTELEVRVEEPPVGNAAIPRKPKKRSMSSLLEDNARSDKRNGRSSKNQKLASGSSDSNKEENNAGLSRPASSSCLSEDDSNGSHEHDGGETQVQALNLSRKTRAGRGAATDPQSLYARKRREKINERLKILQSLVPNGTKVDISTMLEEAVLYVKFLQLQIKLLSSDETWMYAPIAYNGMDIGLNLR